MLKSTLVIGANGFIGSSLTKKLIELNRPVLALVKPAEKLTRLERLSGYNLLSYSNYIDPSLIRKIKDANCKSIVNCSLLSSDFIKEDHSLQIVENMEMTLKCMELAIKIDAKNFVNIGTMEEYQFFIENLKLIKKGI